MLSQDVNPGAAWVNHSNHKITVWSSKISAPGGGLTAGGTQIGSILPNEMYVSRKSSANTDCFVEIWFLNTAGQVLSGYLATYPNGKSSAPSAWRASQQLYHTRKSNGTTLVNNTNTTQIPGANGTFNIFDIVKDVRCYTNYGELVTTLKAGSQIAVLPSDLSRTGVRNAVFMAARYYRLPPVSTKNWIFLDTSASKSFGFVNLEFMRGTGPTTRAIR